MMTQSAHQLINQDSCNTEWYTPSPIIEAARRAMGSIELDPSSSLIANERVKAARIFTEADDGLAQEWRAETIWLNHPFSRIGNKVWMKKIEEEYTKDHFGALCNITFAATSEAWFRTLLKRPQCFLSPRTNYYQADGKVKRGVSKGSVVTYWGPDVGRFAEAFRELGEIKVPYQFA